MEPAVMNKINTSPTLVGRERNEQEKNEFTLTATAAKIALSACRSSEVHTRCCEEEEEEDEEEEEEEEKT